MTSGSPTERLAAAGSPTGQVLRQQGWSSRGGGGPTHCPECGRPTRGLDRATRNARFRSSEEELAGYRRGLEHALLVVVQEGRRGGGLQAVSAAVSRLVRLAREVGS